MPEDTVGPKTAFIAPETPTEEHLAAILIDLLGIDRVGRNDTFMSIGGESILATQFVNRIQAAFGVDVPIDAFFYDEATLVELARIIDDQRSASPSSEAVGVILR